MRAFQLRGPASHELSRDTRDARAYTPIFDQSERRHDDPDMAIAARNEWWIQIKAMIAAAEAVVFMVTLASAESRACDDEIAHARNLGKRVIRVERFPLRVPKCGAEWRLFVEPAFGKTVAFRRGS